MCFHLIFWIQWKIYIIRTCNLLCKRRRCYHSTHKKTGSRRDLEIDPCSCFMIYQIPWIHWIFIPFRESCITVFLPICWISFTSQHVSGKIVEHGCVPALLCNIYHVDMLQLSVLVMKHSYHWTLLVMTLDVIENWLIAGMNAMSVLLVQSENWKSIGMNETRRLIFGSILWRRKDKKRIGQHDQRIDMIREIRGKLTNSYRLTNQICWHELIWHYLRFP